MEYLHGLPDRDAGPPDFKPFTLVTAIKGGVLHRELRERSGQNVARWYRLMREWAAELGMKCERQQHCERNQTRFHFVTR